MAQVFILVLLSRLNSVCSRPHPSLSQRERVRVKGEKMKIEIGARRVATRSMGYAQLLAAYFTGKDVVALTFLDHRRAVDDDGFHSRRMASDFLRVDHVRQLLAHQVIDLVGIKYRHVGGHPFFEHAAVEAQFLGRESGYLTHGFFQAEQILLTTPIAEDLSRRAMPEEPIEMRAHVGADEAGVGFDHFGEQFGMGVGEAVITNPRAEIIFEPGIEERVHRSFFRETRDLFDILQLELFQFGFIEMLKHDAVPTMPFGKFQLAFARDALPFDFSADLFVLELAPDVTGVFDRFPSRQAVEQKAVIEIETADMLVRN